MLSKKFLQGSLNLLYVLNVTFESVTYLAGDYSASAPLRLGRFEGPSAGLCEESCASASEYDHAPTLALRFWLLLRARIMAYVSALKSYRPGAKVSLHYGDPDGPTVEVTLSRAVRRRIAYLYRCGRVGAERSQADSVSVYTHPNARFMVRYLRRKYARRRAAFGRARLNLGSPAEMVNVAALQRGLNDMLSGMACAAPMHPD